MRFTRVTMRPVDRAFRLARARSSSSLSFDVGRHRTFGHAILTRDSDTRIASHRVASRRGAFVEARVRGVDARDDVGVARDVERERARDARRERDVSRGRSRERARSDDGVDATEARRRRRGAARASRTDDDGTTKARARGRGRG
jgi:hypothetical protein